MTTEQDRVEQIKKRLDENAYFINPHSDVNVREDMKFILELLQKKNKLNELLSIQVLELTQEMENVKTDFGDRSR